MQLRYLQQSLLEEQETIPLILMLLYPLAVVLAVWLGLETAASILGDMAAVYFVSVAAIVAAFYGKEAYAAGKK